MKNLKKNALKSRNGITLIALVVTIIVLLILAGISISMLSGNNGILQKATDAKTKTDEAQIKEEIGLAWNSVQIEGIVNGWKLSNKAEKLQLELRKEDDTTTVTANGNIINVKRYKGYDATIDTANGILTKFSKSNEEGGGQDENEILLHLTDIATESRAAIIEVTIDGVDIPIVTNEQKLNWLKTLSTDELREVYAQAQYGIGETWAGHFTGAPFSDVKGYYEYGPKSSGAFIDEYDYMIKTSSINNSNLDSLYYVAQNIDIPSKITVSYNGENSTIDFITKTKAEFVVTKNGSCTVTASNDEGKTGTSTVNVTKCVNRSDNKEEEYSSIQESNYKISKDGYEVWIPAGFAYGTSTNVGTVTTGLVITDSIEEVNGKNYSNGNEFVWIPVEKNDLTVGKTTRKMSEISSETDYRGVLYSWNSDYTGNTQYSSTEYREPAYLTNSTYADASSYNTVGITETSLQKDYNEMIASINEYGGFYVARYELGKNAISKLAVEPTTAKDDNTKTWYGLYSKIKSYTNSKNSVTAQMIWGSQYDAMLQFGLTNSADSSKISATTNGNHTGKELKTGTHKGADSINNIYDLEGNLNEWTQEAYTTARNYGRIVRNIGKAGFISPNMASNTTSSRASLFLKK